VRTSGSGERARRAGSAARARGDAALARCRAGGRPHCRIQRGVDRCRRPGWPPSGADARSDGARRVCRDHGVVRHHAHGRRNGPASSAVLCVARDPLRAREYVATSRAMRLTTGVLALTAGMLLASVLSCGNPRWPLATREGPGAPASWHDTTLTAAASARFRPTALPYRERNYASRAKVGATQYRSQRRGTERPSLMASVSGGATITGVRRVAGC
jgi:hypothetical protein